MVEYNELPEIDKWAIMKINELVKTVTEGYDICRTVGKLPSG